MLILNPDGDAFQFPMGAVLIPLGRFLGLLQRAIEVRDRYSVNNLFEPFVLGHLCFEHIHRGDHTLFEQLDLHGGRHVGQLFLGKLRRRGLVNQTHQH